MKKTFTLISALVCSLLLTYTAKAQDQDRVVTQTGDTIKCEIKSAFLSSTKYTVAGTGEIKKLDIKDIRYYYIAKKNEAYRAVQRPGKTKFEFLELVEEGKICLYRYVVSHYGPTGGYSTTTWYVSKGNDVLQELKTSALFSFKSKKDRKDLFADMLADNEAVLKQYQETDSFSFKNLRNSVHLYNTGMPYEDKRSFVEKMVGQP